MRGIASASAASHESPFAWVTRRLDFTSAAGFCGYVRFPKAGDSGNDRALVPTDSLELAPRHTCPALSVSRHRLSRRKRQGHGPRGGGQAHAPGDATGACCGHAVGASKTASCRRADSGNAMRRRLARPGHRSWQRAVRSAIIRNLCGRADRRSPPHVLEQ